MLVANPCTLSIVEIFHIHFVKIATPPKLLIEYSISRHWMYVFLCVPSALRHSQLSKPDTCSLCSEILRAHSESKIWLTIAQKPCNYLFVPFLFIINGSAIVTWPSQVYYYYSMNFPCLIVKLQKTQTSYC